MWPQWRRNCTSHPLTYHSTYDMTRSTRPSPHFSYCKWQKLGVEAWEWGYKNHSFLEAEPTSPHQEAMHVISSSFCALWIWNASISEWAQHESEDPLGSAYCSHELQSTAHLQPLSCTSSTVNCSSHSELSHFRSNGAELSIILNEGHFLLEECYLYLTTHHLCAYFLRLEMYNTQLLYHLNMVKLITTIMDSPHPHSHTHTNIIHPHTRYTCRVAVWSCTQRQRVVPNSSDRSTGRRESKGCIEWVRPSCLDLGIQF